MGNETKKSKPAAFEASATTNNVSVSGSTSTPNASNTGATTPQGTREYTRDEVVGSGGLEAKLKELISNYKNPNGSPRPGLSSEETEALNQVEAEIVDVKKATISQLDSTLKEPAFSSHGVGLKEHQEHTKSLFDNIIKQKEADAKNAANANNNAKKAEIDKQITDLKTIQANLKEVHEARLCLLNKHQNDETDTRKKGAYKKLKAHWKNLESSNTVTGGPKGTTDLTIDDLFQRKGTTLTNGAGGEIRQLPDGSIEGNDPVAVGIATASAYKKCKFYGMPWDALKAARAALDAGAEEVSFDEETLQNLKNPNLFNSWDDYHRAQAEHGRLKELQAARASVKNSKKSNPIFDPNAPENKALDNLHVLYQLGRPLDENNAAQTQRQIQMLRGMQPIDVAKMAAAEKNTDQRKIISNLYKQALKEEYADYTRWSKLYKAYEACLEQELKLQQQQVTPAPGAGGAAPAPGTPAPAPAAQTPPPAPPAAPPPTAAAAAAPPPTAAAAPPPTAAAPPPTAAAPPPTAAGGAAAPTAAAADAPSQARVVPFAEKVSSAIKSGVSSITSGVSSLLNKPISSLLDKPNSTHKVEEVEMKNFSSKTGEEEDPSNRPNP